MMTRLLLQALVFVLAFGLPAGTVATAQPFVQTARFESPSAISEEWLLGEWETGKPAAAPAPGVAAGLTAQPQGADAPYRLDLQIYRRADGKLEAISTARQIANKSEYVTWKSDIVVKGDTIFATPREIVGHRAWRSYSPANYELRRSGDRLVGWSFSRFWIFDNARRIEFMR